MIISIIQNLFYGNYSPVVNMKLLRKKYLYFRRVLAL